MMLVAKYKPEGAFELKFFSTKVDIEPWKYTKLVSIINVITVIGTCVMFSPIGFSR